MELLFPTIILVILPLCIRQQMFSLGDNPLGHYKLLHPTRSSALAIRAPSSPSERLLLPLSSSSSFVDDTFWMDRLFNASECAYLDRIHGCLYSRCLFEGFGCEAEYSVCRPVTTTPSTGSEKAAMPRLLRCQCSPNYYYSTPVSCVNSSTYYLMQAEQAKEIPSLMTPEQAPSTPAPAPLTDPAPVITTSTVVDGTLTATESTPSSMSVAQPKCGRSPAGVDPFGIANQAHLLNWPMSSPSVVAARTAADKPMTTPKKTISSSNFTDENLIVGGSDVSAGEICWQIGLQISRDDGKHQFCGGTILSDKWIMTAGHCVVTGDEATPETIAAARILFVVIGSLTNGLETQAQKQSAYSPCLEQRFRVNQVVVHPEYKVIKSPATGNFMGIHNDIALLQLSHPIDLTSPCACTMCLANYNDVLRRPFDGEIGITSGYGCQKPDCSDARSASQPANELKYAQMAFVPDQSVSCFGTSNSQMARDYICVGGKFGTDACPGDSGGPFVLYDRQFGVHYQVGIASFVVGDADNFCGLGNPARYTEVSRYVPFIQQYVMDVEVLA